MSLGYLKNLGSSLWYDYFLTGVMRTIGLPIRFRLRRFHQALKQTEAVQQALLLKILRTHADTDFGRAHHFAQIANLADYRRHMPVTTYEYVDPYITRVRQGETQALLNAKRVHMFAMSSGTTASRKYIPVTEQYLADYKRGWNMWGLRAYQDHPAIRLRSILQMSSDMDEFRTESGIPCGSVTGLTAAAQKRIVRLVYCVPPCASKVKSSAAKYYLVLRLSLPRQVRLLIAANPSTVINLARAGDQEKESLIRDIHDGTLSLQHDIPHEVRQAVARRVSKPNPKRARELSEIVNRTGTLYPRDYWGEKCLLGNWTGGSMGAYLRHYPTYFGNMPIRDVGLIASEGRMTIPFADHTPSGVLDITTHFFEFIPEEEANSPQPTVLRAHELQVGRAYYILLTTAYGLYRYNIYDLVRVTGFLEGAPLIEFLSKGSLFSNLTGEKLSEYHVTQAMLKTLQKLNTKVSIYSVAPCWHDTLPYYGLFIEETDIVSDSHGQALTRAFEQHLQEANTEYAAKRESARLDALRLQLLPAGTWQQWDRARLQKSGGTLEQYKHPCLLSDMNLAKSLPIVREIRG